MYACYVYNATRYGVRGQHDYTQSQAGGARGSVHVARLGALTRRRRRFPAALPGAAERVVPGRERQRLEPRLQLRLPRLAPLGGVGITQQNLGIKF